jgi:phosphate transport system protein
MSLLDEQLQRGINLIREKIQKMASQVERALEKSHQALVEKNGQLAYSVIIRDQSIDDLEKEIDRLCLEFLVRQQPVAKHLRFVFAAININRNLERIGDYAENMARQCLLLRNLSPEVDLGKYGEIEKLAVSMLKDAIRAFVEEDEQLAWDTKAVEHKSDQIRDEIYSTTYRLREDGTIPLETLAPLISFARRFERVADRAENICDEVLHMCTGENVKHMGSEVLRMLFVDQGNACRSQMAEGIANSLKIPHIVFGSAGTTPRSVDPKTVEFLAGKGIDIAAHIAKSVNQIPNYEHYQVIVALSKEAKKVFPAPPTRTIGIDWVIDDPSLIEGSEEEIRAGYESTFEYINEHIRDLVQALGESPSAYRTRRNHQTHRRRTTLAQRLSSV